MSGDESLRQIVGLVAEPSDDELLALIRGLNELYKARQKEAAQQAALLLRSGDVVRLPAGARGRVCQVRRGGRVLVHFSEHGDWVVDATLLAKVSGPSSSSEAKG